MAFLFLFYLGEGEANELPIIWICKANSRNSIEMLMIFYKSSFVAYVLCYQIESSRFKEARQNCADVNVDEVQNKASLVLTTICKEHALVGSNVAWLT